MSYSEIVKVGKRGEIYTSSRIRRESGLKPGSYVKVTFRKGILVIRPIRRTEGSKSLRIATPKTK